jgi:hypothetical protein
MGIAGFLPALGFMLENFVSDGEENEAGQNVLENVLDFLTRGTYFKMRKSMGERRDLLHEVIFRLRYENQAQI